MQQPLTASLAKNKAALRTMFGETIDLYTKEIRLFGFPCCICLFEGLSSIERLWIMMLDILSRPPESQPPANPQALFDFVLYRTAIPLEANTVEDLDGVRRQITAGACVILVDGVSKALVISSQSMQFRSVSEPSGEGNIRGSREGFIELLRVNISLVRRLVRSGNLTVETLTVGRRTLTEAALLYDRERVSGRLLDTVRGRLQRASLPFVFDSGYLAGFVQKSRFSFFQSVGYTERPDTAAAKLCEGKLILLVNGSPFAMILPYFFTENFQSMDDYAEKAYFATLIRLFRYASFLLAVLLPGVFVSVANFTPELLPPQLMYKVASAEQATPLPLFMEALLVNFLLEIIREAGLRLPRPIGHAVSLVAALIIGDAAVSAGLLGTPLVIVSALTALCTFVVPNLYEPVIVLRILFILAGGILGPVGVAVLFFCMVLGMCEMNAFGIPYMAPAATQAKAFLRDGLLRSGWQTLAKADFTVGDLQQKVPEQEGNP